MEWNSYINKTKYKHWSKQWFHSIFITVSSLRKGRFPVGRNYLSSQMDNTTIRLTFSGQPSLEYGQEISTNAHSFSLWSSTCHKHISRISEYARRAFANNRLLVIAFNLTDHWGLAHNLDTGFYIKSTGNVQRKFCSFWLTSLDFWQTKSEIVDKLASSLW